MNGEKKMINIDFLLSGCNTRCRHCYVAGGPGSLMATDTALQCLEKLDALAGYLPGEVTFTLDHEPMNHPDVKRIIHAASGTKRIRYYHHGMTTGIGLMRREDRDDVLRAYMDCGYRSFGITIHGNAVHHDEIVRRGGAYEATVSAAEFLRSRGAELEVSLMVNRFFPGDAEDITALISRLRPGYVGCVFPIYTPHANMADFEPYRAALPEIELLREILPRWQQDTAELLECARGLTVSAAVSRLRSGTRLRSLFEAPQDELYLTLHQDGVLYVGNSGAETQRIGDLREMDPREMAGWIAQLPGNRDYGAFYDVDALPETDQLIRALEGIPQNLVYGDFESAVYRGLSLLGVPARILRLP